MDIKLNTTNADYNEIECRFGLFKNKQFINGIAPNDFYRLYNVFESMNTEKVQSISVDEIKSVSKTNYIKMSSQGHFEYMKKTRVSNQDFMDYNMRLSMSKEESSTLEEFESIQNVKSYFRKKARTSFICPTAKVDMTVVNDESFELEIEFKTIKNSTNEIDVPFIESVFLKLCAIPSMSCYVFPQVQLQLDIFIKSHEMVMAQAETITGETKKLLEQKQFALAEKYDGRRAFLIHFNECVYIQTTTQTILTDIVSSERGNWIMDGELYETVFYAFDMLYAYGVDQREKKLGQRQVILYHLLEFVNSGTLYKCQAKPMYIGNLKQVIQYLDEDLKLVETDGYIFTPIDETYPKIKKWAHLLKWKSHNTIDFQVELKDTYVSLQVVGKDGKLVEYAQGSLDYFKQFPYHIVECVYRHNVWFPLKFRWDKVKPNYIDIANNIMKKRMISKTELTQFKNNVPQQNLFKSMWNLINKQKYELFKRIVPDSTLLDIGVGKAHDMNKWISNKIKHVDGVDISKNMIDKAEQFCKEQKYSHFTGICKDAREYLQNCDKKYDAITCFTSIQYVFDERFPSLISQSLNERGLFMGIMYNDIPEHVCIHDTTDKFKMITSQVQRVNNQLQLVQIGNYTSLESRVNFNDLKQAMEEHGFVLKQFVDFSQLFQSGLEKYEEVLANSLVSFCFEKTEKQASLLQTSLLQATSQVSQTDKEIIMDGSAIEVCYIKDKVGMTSKHNLPKLLNYHDSFYNPFGIDNILNDNSQLYNKSLLYNNCSLDQIIPFNDEHIVCQGNQFLFPNGTNETIQHVLDNVKTPEQIQQELVQSQETQNNAKQTYEKMTIVQLKVLLKERGLKSSGSKAELVERLL